MQDDEINLQCQLVEKLKQQMLDQDEVLSCKQKHTWPHYIARTKAFTLLFFLTPYFPLSSSWPLPVVMGTRSRLNLAGCRWRATVPRLR